MENLEAKSYTFICRKYSCIQEIRCAFLLPGPDRKKKQKKKNGGKRLELCQTANSWMQETTHKLSCTVPLNRTPVHFIQGSKVFKVTCDPWMHRAHKHTEGAAMKGTGAAKHDITITSGSNPCVKSPSYLLTAAFWATLHISDREPALLTSSLVSIHKMRSWTSCLYFAQLLF